MTEGGGNLDELFGDRQKKFMQGLDTEDFKRKKDDKELELRKQKRNDTLSRRRNITEIDHDWIKVNEVYKAHYTLTDLPEVVVAANSDKDDLRLFAAQALRKMLSLQENPPIQQVIDTGVLSKLIDGIQRFDFSQLQYESAWAITNIASGTSMHTQTIIEKGAVPLLINLLHSTNETVRDQAAWALGNIGGDAAHCRDLILQHGGLALLMNCFETATRQSTIKNSSWAISNLCRGKPPPKFDLVFPSLKVLSKVIKSASDNELLADCCWAIAHLSDGTKERIQTLIDYDITETLLQLAVCNFHVVQLPALRCCGNIASGSNDQTQYAINLGLLNVAKTAIDSPRPNIKKEAVWIISNISAGTVDQIQCLIQAEVYPKIAMALTESEYEIKKEALWAVCNAVAAATPEQVSYLAQCGALLALCGVLTTQESSMLVVALEGIRHFLEKGKTHFSATGVNPFADQVSACGGLDRLERLQSHPNNKVYEKAYKLIVTYFEVEEDEYDGLLGAIRECAKFNF
mmetsp:Transcript_24875/g.43744  ORF Transcript_24875/g.43744 Transcript_24875/m.43744 type:complete len:517 (+) Transcript_24875:978-2528(+)